MNKLKKLVKKDFEDKLNSKPSFDVNTLPIDDNYKFNKQRKIKMVKKVVSFSLLSLVSVFVVSFASLVMGLTIDIDENGKLHERIYSKNEIELIESGSYKKLNDITYPNGERNFYTISETYKEALVNFTYDIYSNVEFKDDFSYSPLTLYNNLSILSIASDDEDVNLKFDKLMIRK